MNKRIKLLLLLVCLSLSLTGCGSLNKEYSSVVDLRDAFVKAGGQCWEWKLNDPVKAQVPSHKEDADCDQKTVLIVFADGVSAQEEALQFASTLRSLKFRVNVLVGKNWMINSDQVTKVYAQMGGTLITR